ncbi:MAG TPA: hypothetical protein VLV86_01320 [Vicinamibacterales bacterium]|nr:hypothetical protein [Vicinamibacterales bacterium]
MQPLRSSSEFRFEKRRVDATVTLSSGLSARGCFFTAANDTRHDGPERVGDLLNAEAGFVPFELHDGTSACTLLYNRAHVVMVRLHEREERHDAGFDLATPRLVSILLTTGQLVVGTVRVYRPLGRDRLSDWTRQPETFRYLETVDMTVLVNAAHIVHISEVSEP